MFLHLYAHFDLGPQITQFYQDGLKRIAGLCRLVMSIEVDHMKRFARFSITDVQKHGDSWTLETRRVKNGTMYIETLRIKKVNNTVVKRHPQLGTYYLGLISGSFLKSNVKLEGSQIQKDILLKNISRYIYFSEENLDDLALNWTIEKNLNGL
jgi:hypothetical protein